MSKTEQRLSIFSKQLVKLLAFRIITSITHIATFNSIALQHPFFKKITSTTMHLIFRQFINSLPKIECLITLINTFIRYILQYFGDSFDLYNIFLLLMSPSPIYEDILFGRMSMHINYHRIVVLFIHILNKLYFRSSTHILQIGISILSIQVLPNHTVPKVPNNNPINIQHWHNIEFYTIIRNLLIINQLIK